MVKVKFFGVLSDAMPEKDEQGFWHISASGKTVEDVLKLTSIKEKNIRYSIYVNNVRKDHDYILTEGDTLTIMPLLVGG